MEVELRLQPKMMMSMKILAHNDQDGADAYYCGIHTSSETEMPTDPENPDTKRVFDSDSLEHAVAYH